MYEPFGRGFYEWWAGLNPVFRYGVGAAVVVAAGLLWWLKVFDAWFCGSLAVVGIILLLFAGGRDD